VLLPFVEEGLLVLVGATTENPFFSLTGPLLSRSTLFRLEPLDDGALAELAQRALSDDERGLANEPTVIDDDALKHLVDKSEGDARHLLTVLEVAHALTVQDDRTTITLGDAEAALALRSVRYGDDEHYDIISAFIKSIRGSDPDAGLYWLARMLEAGEDPLFVARRLVISAAEDVGLADPQALQVAMAAQQAAHFVGMPEAVLPLTEAALYLALAPKSNSALTSYGAARELIAQTGNEPVPLHLRNAVTGLMKSMGYGRDYKYAHDYDGGVANQVHMPEKLKGRKVYKPGSRDLGSPLRGELPTRPTWWRRSKSR